MRLSTASILMVLATAALAPAAAQERPNRLVFAAYNDAAESHIAEAVLREAYRRLGITIEIQHFAGDVGVDRVNTGAVDGMLARVDGIEDRFPNVIQVRAPVVYVDVAVYSRDSSLRVRDWRDLTSLNVGTVRGMLYIDRSLGDLRVRYVDTYGELYPLLFNRQVDAIVASELHSRTVLGSRRGAFRNGVIASYMQYHYLIKRHEALVPQVERELREMLMDGTVARIRQATMITVAARLR